MRLLLAWLLLLILLSLRFGANARHAGRLASFCAAREADARAALEADVGERGGAIVLRDIVEWREGRPLPLPGVVATGHGLIPLATERGRRVRISARWRCRYPFRNPASQSDRLVPDAPRLVPSGPLSMETARPGASLVARGQASLLEWVERSFRRSPLVTGLVRAVWSGDDRGVPGVVTRAHRAVGLSHVLALSGQHIAALSLWLFLGLRLVSHVLPSRSAAYRRLALHGRRLAPVAASLLLCLASGGCESILRASAMLAAALWVRYRGWHGSPIQWLGSSAALLLLLDPSLLGRPGFFLSAASTAFLLHALVESSATGWRAYLVVTLTLPILLWPLGAFFFGTFPLAAPLAGLALVWLWDGVLIPAGFALPLFMRGMPEGLTEEALAQIERAVGAFERASLSLLPLLERGLVVCPRPTWPELLAAEALLLGAFAWLARRSLARLPLSP